MEISDVPRLCGSTFHMILIKIKNDYTPVDQEWWNGDAFSKNLTEAQFFRALISVFDPRGKLRFHNNPRDYARQLSDYKKGTENYNTGLGFPFDEKFAITVDDAVQQEYKKYLNRMTKFCNDYIQCKGAATDDVVEELRELIAADDTVGTPMPDDPHKDEANMFYADTSGRAITKEELLDQKVIYLPAFLLGIWHYIIVHRVKNSAYRQAMSDTALDWIDEEHKLSSDIHVTMNLDDVPVTPDDSEVEPAVVPDADQNGVVDCGSEDDEDKIVDFGDEDQESSEDSADDGSAENTDVTSPKEPIIPGAKLLFPQSWAQDEIDEFMSGVDYTAPEKDPEWPADLDPESYSLLMAHTIDFTSGSIELDRDRCGNKDEFSDEELVAQYGAFTHDQMQDICRMPVLLMEENKPEPRDETRIRKIAYVGVCNKITKMTGMYRFKWTMLFAFPQEAIELAIDYLDIISPWPHGEMRRTHQAFKYVNLCEVLREEVGIDIPVPVEQAASVASQSSFMLT